MYSQLGDVKNAITSYERLILKHPNHSASGSSYFYLGNLLFYDMQYEKAEKRLVQFLQFRNPNPSFVTSARKTLKDCVFAKVAIKNPVDFDPKNVGPGINTRHNEYFSTTTVDDKTFLFTRLLPAPAIRSKQEDFYITERGDVAAEWPMSFPMPSNINSSRNEGAPCFAPDGKTLVFVSCADIDGRYGALEGKGSCDLFITTRFGNKWKDPENIPGEINSWHWESQPSLSSDGKTLYFVRGIRKPNNPYPTDHDIYVSKRLSNGKWSKPDPLPYPINTPYKEESVFIHPDGKTLYFSSEGHPGFGGSDIFMSRMKSNGSWSVPVNLGFPINTSKDENSVMVSSKGTVAYYSSNRAGGFGGLDIYSFHLPKQVRPLKVSYLEGVVYDVESLKRLGANFELIDLTTGEIVVHSLSDPQEGDFLVTLPVDRSYALNVSKKGYNFYSKNFDFSKDNASDQPLHLDIPMIPIALVESTRLDNVFFDLDQSNLRTESFIELNKLVEFLSQQPELNIEIQGHTDHRGDSLRNQLLSENRAKSVVDYLISNGISANRLRFKGYGSSVPSKGLYQGEPSVFTPNYINQMPEKDRKWAHQQNRRTEFIRIQ